MVGGAAHWINQRGWKAVLGGPCPFDPLWLDLMGQRGVLAEMAAVGLHGFPGTWDSDEGSWRGWAPLLERDPRDPRSLQSGRRDLADRDRLFHLAQ